MMFKKRLFFKNEAIFWFQFLSVAADVNMPATMASSGPSRQAFAFLAHAG